METQDWEEGFWNPNWSPLGFQVNHQTMVMKSLMGGGFLSPFSKKKITSFQLPTPEHVQRAPSPVLLRIFVACVAEPNPPMDPMQ